MSEYKFDAARWLRSNARAHHARKDFDTSSTMRTIAEEIDNLRARLAEVEAQRDVYKEATLGFRDGLRLIHSGDHEDKPHSVAGRVLRVQGEAIAKLEAKDGK